MADTPNASGEPGELYLDAAATESVSPAVIEAMTPFLTEAYANPASVHQPGKTAARALDAARASFAAALGARPDDVIFTSGGTESDNLAIKGIAMARMRALGLQPVYGLAGIDDEPSGVNPAQAGEHPAIRRPRIIISSIEHPAIINTMRFLEEEEGFRVTYLPVDQYGRIRLDALKEALCEDTILVSIMYVNNEVGSVQPIQEAASIVKAYNKDILFHVDAVQGFGKYKIYPKKLKVDMCSISGHKIHGPKGVGALYIGENVKIRPIVYGGGQQHDMRSGTENVPGIAGLSLAAKTIYDNLDEKVEKMRALKQHFIEGVEKIENTTIHGLYDETSAPHIISVGIAGIRSEVLLHALEDKGIYVSSGSACASNHPQISGVLKGIGAKQEFLDATLRFSMSEFTTLEEIDYTLDALYNIVPMLRRYTRH